MKNIILVAVVLFFLHILILSQLRFTAWPEMFSYPYLLNHGFNLYQDIALPYQPLLPLILSVIFNLFGYSLSLVIALTWGVIIICDLLIFFISVKVIGWKLISVTPLLLYVLIQPFAEGNMLWFDLATTPFLLLGLISFLFLKESKNLFFLGFFLSLAFFIKQQVGLIFILVGFYLLFKDRSFLKLYPFILGSLIPTIFIICYVLIKDLWGSYLFWTVEVPLVWYPKFPGYTNWPSIRQILILLLLLAPGAIFSIRQLKNSKEFGVIFAIFLAVFVTSFPRFELFRFQPAIAVYIILIALLIARKPEKFFFLIIPSVVTSLILFKSVLPMIGLPVRFYGGDDIEIINSIKSSSENDSNIYLLGVSSLVYVITEKLPPKPWIDNYVWYMEIPGIQDRVLEGFQAGPPSKIFWQMARQGNWFQLGVYQPKKIVEYIKTNYQNAGMIDQGIEVWARKN